MQFFTAIEHMDGSCGGPYQHRSQQQAEEHAEYLVATSPFARVWLGDCIFNMGYTTGDDE